MLVGNTRALWPKFLAARRADPELAASSDPLERYVESSIECAVASSPGARVYYSHRRYDGAFLPFQRLAVAIGLGALAPTQLVIHPIYGPWFALRAIIVTVAGPTPRREESIPQPCNCTRACFNALAHANTTNSWQSWLAVRDACPIGRSWRYGDDQIRYHYTKDASSLC
jgi:methylmalonic aciduria homocystinuria type C protein